MRNFLKYFIICVLFFGISVFCFKSVLDTLTPKYPEVDTWEPYVVESGDTLWEICPRYDGCDVRHLIDMVNEYNGIQNIIYAGQTIYLPVYK